MRVWGGCAGEKAVRFAGSLAFGENEPRGGAQIAHNASRHPTSDFALPIRGWMWSGVFRHATFIVIFFFFF